MAVIPCTVSVDRLCGLSRSGGRATTLDRKALDRFLADVERRAYRMALVATGDADEAMDLVQDAMFGLVQRYASRDQAEWGPLFHTILQSRIRDWYRRAKVRHRWRQWFGQAQDEEQSDPLEAIADPAQPSSEDQLIVKRAGAALEQALQTLPLRQQQAFLLRAWEELSVSDTAKAMGCSEGSVKTHYFRAVRTLRTLLGDHWL